MTDRKTLDKIVDGYARAAHKLMKNRGFVRQADNLAPQAVTVEELANELDFPDTMWDTIKDRMLDLGIPVVYQPGRGHYIGFKGEVVMNVHYNMMQVQGRLNRMRRWLIIFGEKHNLEEGEIWMRQHGLGSLAQFAKRLQANADLGGLEALPHDLHVYLLEASSKSVGLS